MFTVKQLREALKTLDDNLIVIMSTNSYGDRFSALHKTSEGLSVPADSFEFLIDEEDMSKHPDQYGDIEQYAKVLILWPDL